MKAHLLCNGLVASVHEAEEEASTEQARETPERTSKENRKSWE
jgi:hypothetical protein